MLILRQVIFCLKISFTSCLASCSAFFWSLSDEYINMQLNQIINSYKLLLTLELYFVQVKKLI